MDVEIQISYNLIKFTDSVETSIVSPCNFLLQVNVQLLLKRLSYQKVSAILLSIRSTGIL